MNQHREWLGGVLGADALTTVMQPGGDLLITAPKPKLRSDAATYQACLAFQHCG